MSFKDMIIEKSYISLGDNSIATSFITPLLKNASLYKRSVGFFSSSVLKTIMPGVISFARNKGKIQLIASPRLSEEDIEAINLGYDTREKIVSKSFATDFVDAITSFDDVSLKLLTELIAKNILDIKVAVTNSLGIYHDKLGIFEDFDGNKVVFYGSANSSGTAYKNNYEKIRVIKSWNQSDVEAVNEESNEFDALWNGENPFVQTYNYSDCAQQQIIEVIKEREVGNGVSAPVKLRDYQIEAIDAWVKNNYHGFYVMATGTGKTWTAIFSAKELLKSHSALLVICAPYKHLIKQWAEDIEKAFDNKKIILVSSENPKWEEQLTNEIIAKQYYPEHQIIVVSTIASFKMEKFNKTINKSKEDKMLIVDEAHRFTDRDDTIKQTYKYMLGLSATPYSGFSAQKGKELMEFFGGQVFNLPIEEALKKGYLVPYYYHPIFVSSTEEEEEKFQYQTKLLVGCFKGGVCQNTDLLLKAIRNRLRIISMSSEKQKYLESAIDLIQDRNHFVVYCGDGKLFDSSGNEVKHIKSVKEILNKKGYKASQFTANENMQQRMNLVSSFNNGEIDALAAIRCLDEGINIPSIKSALILSSNDDYREFVQRRGRILRTYPGKKDAHIYDIIVLPSCSLTSWAKIELRRFYEYARLAINKDSLLETLYEKQNNYGLNIDDINVFDYEDMEDTIDE